LQTRAHFNTFISTFPVKGKLVRFSDDKGFINGKRKKLSFPLDEIIYHKIKNMKRFCLLLFVFTLGCKPASSGYKDLDKLYADFVIVLKDTSEMRLKQYCYDITPDENTVKFMKENKFSYRGIPEELEKQNLKVSVIGDNYFKQVTRFREKLVNRGQLTNLKYIGREEPGEEVMNKELHILATETFIILTSGSDTIRCKLGEMFKVDGVWKSFTQPKLGW
jgi:hypothetical protein